MLNFGDLAEYYHRYMTRQEAKVEAKRIKKYNHDTDYNYIVILGIIMSSEQRAGVIESLGLLQYHVKRYDCELGDLQLSKPEVFYPQTFQNLIISKEKLAQSREVWIVATWYKNIENPTRIYAFYSENDAVQYISKTLPNNDEVNEQLDKLANNEFHCYTDGNFTLYYKHYFYEMIPKPEVFDQCAIYTRGGRGPRCLNKPTGGGRCCAVHKAQE